MSDEIERWRADTRARWERSGEGWGRAADVVRDTGMPVSRWMIDQLSLQPGQRVLELAAGPGDTGFLAAELIAPGGRLICSDAVEAMLEIARRRAIEQEVRNVEFKLLELEWIDLAAASVDAILCRWGLMFCTDPSAALREMRRVLAPGGRAAVAVWDVPERNPWATIPSRALVELGIIEPPDPSAPGMFSLADPLGLRAMFEDAGFLDVAVEAIDLPRSVASVVRWIAETRNLSRPFAEACEKLSDEQGEALEQRIEALAAAYTRADGTLELPGSSLVAAAGA